MVKKLSLYLVISIIFAASFVFAAPISDELHLNIQTLDDTGDVVTGKFTFVFNISSFSNCSSAIYSKTASLTTDSRGIISYYLTGVDLPYDSQYYLCYYRDGELINTSTIARTPYAFRARNVTLSGVEVDSNLNMTGYNITASTGFFSFLGNFLNFITGLFVQDINLNGTLSGNGSINLSGGNISTTGIISAENVSVNNTLNVSGDIIGSGDVNTTGFIFTSGNVRANGDICLDDGTCLSTVVDEALSSSFNASYFYNKTTANYRGNLSAGGYLGYRAAHYICDQEFAGSHMCYESELMLTIDQGNISNIPSWTGSAWIMTGGAKYSPASVPVSDCKGFTHGSADSYLGSFWIFNQTTGGYGGVGHCANEIPLACCKPGGII